MGVWDRICELHLVLQNNITIREEEVKNIFLYYPVKIYGTAIQALETCPA